MKSFKNIFLASLSVTLAICGALASTSFTQQAWYNAATDPELDPTIAILASITSPNDTDIRNPNSLCPPYASLLICTTNGRQIFKDKDLTIPLFRDF